MFIAPLFTIAKIWKQPKYPSTDEWVKMWHIYIYNGILLSHKKNELLPFITTWTDLEGIMLSELSLTEKDKYCISFICGISKIKQTSEYKRNRIIDIENKLVVISEEREGVRDKRGVGA